VLPVVAAYPGSDKTTLGEGAALTIDGLRSWSPEFSPEGFATRFVDGVEAEEVAADLDLAPSQFIDVDAVGRPSDVASLDRVRSTPVLLTALLATLIALTVTHALGAAVRARRRELAVLRTFGFSRAQVLGAVATQATLIAAVGLVIGIPVGIAAGRLAWSRVAEDLGAFVSLVTPTLALTVVAVAVVGVANLVGLVPGLRAAAAHPADTLRTE
jgi:ABC-type antimicrobial peptide transport system permease subunit